MQSPICARPLKVKRGRANRRCIDGIERGLQQARVEVRDETGKPVAKATAVLVCRNHLGHRIAVLASGCARVYQ